MKRMMILLAALMSINVSAERFERPIANPGETTWQENFQDFVWRMEGYGYEQPSEEIVAFIRSIMDEMGMSDWNISFRKMSRGLITGGMRENAFVVQCYMPGMMRMWVSEEWFNELSHEEKVFLIRHELTHLQKGHVSKKLLCVLGIVSAYWAMNYTIDQCRLDKRLSTANTALYWASLIFGTAYFSRVCEREADAGGTKDVVGAQGGMKLFKTWLDKRDPQSRFWFNRMLSSLGEKIFFFVPWLSTHPELEDRYEYCEAQYEKLKAQA